MVNNLKFGLWNEGKLEYVLGCEYDRTFYPNQKNGYTFIHINVFARRFSGAIFGAKYEFYVRNISLTNNHKSFFKEQLLENKEAAEFLLKYKGPHLDKILEAIEFCTLAFPYETL